MPHIHFFSYFFGRSSMNENLLEKFKIYLINFGFPAQMHLIKPILFIKIIFLIFLLVDISVCLTDNDEFNSRYSNCSTLRFECGDLKNISYPFWGNARPDYCGLPGYKLNCLDSVVAEIEIMSQRYRVLSINQANYNMRLARKDFMDEDHDHACPSRIHNTINTTLDDVTPFDHTFGDFGDMFLILLYDCPSVSFAPGEFPNMYKIANHTCITSNGSISDTSSYFWIESIGGTVPSSFKNFSSACRNYIQVPVMDKDLGGLKNDPSTLYSVLREGFNWTYAAKLPGPLFYYFCKSCEDSSGACGYSLALQSMTCFCPFGNPDILKDPASSSCPTPVPRGHRSNARKKVQIIGAGAAVGGVILLALSIFMLIRCLRKPSLDDSLCIRFWNKDINSNGNKKLEDFFKTYGSLAPKRFRYMDVKKMTNSFKEKLGQGGYGSVFKGQLHDGRLVAVKVLLSKSKSSNGEEFLNEVASISRTCHVNIVTLVGFCFEGNKRALVYEFMPNGSLDKFIYGEKQSFESDIVLGWEKLYQIAVGIARGLEYLHRGCTTRILHFDIKPHNILLDEHFFPKISDFGLAKLCPGQESNISMLGARGTAGYIAPEVFNRNFGSVSHKSDVYSYGMMVLEMIGGRKNIDVKAGIDHSSQLYFPYWIYDRLKLDESLGVLHGVITEEREITARKMVIVGLWCIQANPSRRPSMSKVLEMLEGSVEALQIPPKPFLSSPSSSPPKDSSL